MKKINEVSAKWSGPTIDAVPQIIQADKCDARSAVGFYGKTAWSEGLLTAPMFSRCKTLDEKEAATIMDIPDALELEDGGPS